MPRLLFAITLMPSLLMTGCASSQLDNLVPVTINETLMLNQEIRLQDPPSVMSGNFGYRLAPGLYTAVKANAAGTFFQGEGQSLTYIMGANSENLVGGIWIPVAANARPRLYFVTVKADPNTDPAIDNVTRNYASNAIAGGGAIVPTTAGASIGGAILKAIPKAKPGKITLFGEISDSRAIGVIQSAYANRTH
ncbi:MAG TPA: hypothetical protein VFW42_01400 [Fluviicoccus sp.]|nr:hypothetical protein [Fluviicoccus sp.]